jgi:hypothetical protein
MENIVRSVHNNYHRFEQEVPKATLLKDPSLNFVQDGNLFTSNGPCSGLATALRVVEVHCGTGYKNNLRKLIEYIVLPAKGALVENGKTRYITVSRHIYKASAHICDEFYDARMLKSYPAILCSRRAAFSIAGSARRPREKSCFAN